MLKHNSYFDGQVQSVGFERLGRAASVGVIDGGTHTFTTAAPERMTVISGELFAELPGVGSMQLYAAGTAFEVPGNSSFTVKATAAAAYLCEYL